MKRMFVDTAAGQIHYRTEGTGEALVLLHEVPLSSTEFSEVIPILGQHYCALAMDLPSYGDSYKSLIAPRVEDLAQVVLDFLDALSIKKAHIAGHHAGAAIAVEIAAEHSERVNKLVLSGCPSWSLEEGLSWLKKPQYRVLEITPDGWFMRHIWDFTLQRIPEDCIDRMDKAYECALEYMKSGTRAEEAHQAIFRYDIRPKMLKIKQPTLAMCGEKDPLFPLHESTLKHIPHTQGHIIKDGPSWAPRLVPQEWSRLVAEFLGASH